MLTGSDAEPTYMTLDEFCEWRKEVSSRPRCKTLDPLGVQPLEDVIFTHEALWEAYPKTQEGEQVKLEIVTLAPGTWPFTSLGVPYRRCDTPVCCGNPRDCFLDRR